MGEIGVGFDKGISQKVKTTLQEVCRETEKTGLPRLLRSDSQ